MPMYEYRCTACHETFSRQEKMAEHDTARPVCPKCKSRKVMRLMSGFYARTPRKS
ncbi:MAG TPA: zinc ribbon domain-containing protein [Gemmatimonadaceae bacterium]|nr:zinc ribbon domain-containing protein [Gemmatimonadaceae bacterium]